MSVQQIERIVKMEAYLDEAEEVLGDLARALERYGSIREKLKALEAYYEGPLWREDFEDDGRGRLPNDLKRGVLSEDALWELLEEHDRILREAGDFLQKSSTLPPICPN